MYIESVSLKNFRCFGPDGATIALEPNLTAFIGNNGSGKTAACQGLQRMFGISSDERTVRIDDFHVPADEQDAPTSRTLSIDATFAFPELAGGGPELFMVADFFRHLAATPDGDLKFRAVLTATWTDDGTVDGSVETALEAVQTLAVDYTPDQAVPLTASDRSRIQMVYVPASRDGARQVTTFLRGRVWRAARWSTTLREMVARNAEEIGEQFHGEPATRAVESAFARRWSQLHGAGVHATPRFQPLEPDVDQLIRNAELTFEPDHTGSARPARLLSDGQRSLLHLALTTASLDLEASLLGIGAPASFDVTAAYLPALTVLAVEEPENNLSPFYLSRIIGQALDVGRSPRVQVLLSSHSASSLNRVEPTAVRYFRHNPDLGIASVRPITLPPGDTQAGTYVREAVRAHPELYFARFVVLGEGDSEQVVLPRIARALGVDLDPSFVAMVPLGGRHIQHFWRLLTDLQIPHATLLDLDYGRAGGGAGRLRTACANLAAFGIDVYAELDDFNGPEDLDDDLTLTQLKPVRAALKRYGVFYCSLDLDMLLLRHYPDAYQALDEGEHGPGANDATDAVLGAAGTADARSQWTPADPVLREQRQLMLRWYRYLFANRSKPATHLRALSRLSDEDLAEPPQVLRTLIEFIRDRVPS